MSSADASDPPPTQSSGTAEDRKAASALADLDSSAAADASSANNVDHEAVSKAVSSLPANKTASSSSATTAAPGAAAKKTVKVDAADVALLVDQIEVTKARATELLKAHDGDAVAALRAVARG